MTIKFYNTRTHQKEDFIPLKNKKVHMYSCGPTVYDYAHIGNLRAYIFTDILRRTLKYNNYKIKQIMNFTDVGHLSSDADSGDDKMTKALKREGKDLTLKNMRAVGKFYAEKFKEDLKDLNIEKADGMYFASSFIKENIELIKKLAQKNFTYQISDGIYFDTTKMSDYGILWGGYRKEDENEARIEKNSEKKNQRDFALWKFNSEIGFPSIWGQGFPGWHLECSAMSMKFLGEQFDIHTGGVDHISIHHTNEIAQSECATGKKPSVNFWMHNEHIDISGARMAKSEGNFLKLSNLKEKNINPLAYRFLVLMASYRTKINFNWEALEGAQIALKRLQGLYLGLGKKNGLINKDYQSRFMEMINDDLDTPGAIALLWDLFRDERIIPADKKATILNFDKVLALGFGDLKEIKIPKEIKKLVQERELARKNKDYSKSDELRKKINSLGYEIKDSESGFEINKI